MPRKKKTFEDVMKSHGIHSDTEMAILREAMNESRDKRADFSLSILRIAYNAGFEDGYNAGFEDGKKAKKNESLKSR